MRLWFGLALAVLWAWPVAADDAIPMPISELAQRAQLIVRGKVEGKSVRRDAEKRIFTEVNLAVQEVWKGDPKGPLLKVVQGGGVLGEEKVVVVGQVDFRLGEEVVGFFVWNPRGEAVTLSMSQGKFLVKRKGGEGAEVENPFHGRKEKDIEATPALKLDDLRARVREALK